MNGFSDGSHAVVKAPDAGAELFVASFEPPPHLLLLGGGPDARPVASVPWAKSPWRKPVASAIAR